MRTVASRPQCRATANLRSQRRMLRRVSAAPTTAASTGTHVFHYSQIEVETKPGIALFDITPQIRQQVQQLGVTEGFVNVLSRHTTTAVAINEYETRLLDDIRQFLHKLAPPNDPYLHNDLHLREAPADWPGGWEAW
eukprot:GHUV01013374.1.p1 GENE.GHUV01013374.1~~GHUV01013374.1.p1  ORF type:complete len:137 (+),score=15.44 GHUV01013374.1:111-521(+)